MEQTAKSYRLLPAITGLFVATLIIAETTASKLLSVGPMTLSAAIIIFPLSYLFNDILTEVYGYRVSRKVIWTGFASLILMIFCYEGVLALPGADFWKDQAAFQTVLGNLPRIVTASMTAYFVGEFCNSFALAKFKVKMEGKLISLRFVASTVVGEFVDSIIFFPMAFYGVLPNATLVSIILSSWGLKILWEIAALPATLPFVRYLKRIEHEDHYDRHTDFNPFKF